MKTLMEILGELPDPLTTLDIAGAHRIPLRTAQNLVDNGAYVGGHRIEVRKGIDNGGAYKIGRLWRVPREAWLAFLRDSNPETMRGIAEKQEAERRRQRKELKRLRTQSN